MSKQSSSYSQILKSTSIFGGSQLVGIVIGFIRAKVVALLLGTAGIGLIGNFQSITEMIRSITGLGIDSSGMREVAASSSLDDKKSLSETIAVLKWWVKVTALLGFIACLILCYPISNLVFDSSEYAWQIALLSISTFLIMLTLGQTIVMQGMRKIPYLVKTNIYGNIANLVVSIPIYFLFGLNGIIFSLIAGAMASFIISHIYYKKLDIDTVHIPAKVAFAKGKRIVKLGFFIVLASMCGTISMFAIRSFISHNIGLNDAGLFHAVWSITGIYLALILRSMGSDYYPRLCNIIKKNVASRRLVNEQTYIVLIVASPIIIGMVMFSKLALLILYSSDFVAATTLFQWQILGTFLKVLSWPMGFIILAKGKGLIFFLSEFCFYLVYLLASYLLLPYLGLNAVGVGYLIAYATYLINMFVVASYLSNFMWRKGIIYLSIIYLILICTTFYAMQNLPETIAYSVAGCMLVASLAISVFKLNKVIDIKSLLNRKAK